MAGGLENKRTPGCVVLTIKQKNGKYVPELYGLSSGEQPIYSAHGRFCIDMDCGVHLTREGYHHRVFPDNIVGIYNRIRYSEIDIVVGGETQTIVPFPYHYDDKFREDEIKVGDNVIVSVEDGLRLISFNKINSRCDLRVFDSSGSHQHQNPLVEARLSYVPKKMADKMIEKETDYQDKMQKFFRKKGWNRLM